MDTFEFNGKKLAYDRSNDQTRLGERCVEVPIFKNLMKSAKNAVIEIGNVMSAYGVKGQTVIDKHEKATGVMNVDVIDLKTDESVDIFSVSTLEHVGKDMGGKEDGKKLIKFFTNLLKNCPNVQSLTYSFPWGYNQTLDDITKTILTHEGGFGFKVKAHYIFKRTTKANEWAQVETLDEKAQYGKPFEYGNQLSIILLEAE